MRRLRIILQILLVVLAVSFLASARTSHAQDGDLVQPSVAEPESAVSGDEAEVPPELATPRKCYETFRSAMLQASEGESGALDTAAECLDLSGISPLIRTERGRELAVMLARIIDYSPPVDVDSIPDNPDSPPVTIIRRDEDSITLRRDAEGAWHFGETTVAAIPGIFNRMELTGEFETISVAREPEEMLSGGIVERELGIRAMIPQEWKTTTFLIEDWQWGYVVVLLILGYIVYLLIPLIVAFILNLWLKQVLQDHDATRLTGNMSRATGLLAVSLLWWILPARSGLDEGLLVTILVVAKILLVVSIVWLTWAAVDITTEYIQYRMTATDREMDPSLLAFINGMMKVLAIFIALVLIASNMGVNVTGLIAGLGIGGIAIALAAKEPLENLFASLIIFMDRPFHAGDWIISDTIEGIVENVGFRSTRLRTFYNSVITIPNAELARINIDNMGVRPYRRIKTTISVTYGTPPAKMEAFCAGIRELVRIHPYTRNERYYVWFSDFGPSSLDIELICHLNAHDFATERREKHRLFLDIMRLAQTLGVEFAFPTQTIYMGEEKAPEPIFPDTGDIFSATRKQIDFAKKKAHEIASSELGGEDVQPEPFLFEDPGESITGR